MPCLQQRLGLGATPLRDPASPFATANPNSAESRILQGILKEGRKRKVEEIPESVPSSSKAAQISNKPVSDGDDSETESRTKSISAKVPKTINGVNDFFHTKTPVSIGVGNVVAEASKNHKKKQRKTQRLEASLTAADFTIPQPPTHRMRSPSVILQLPPLSDVKPPYALTTNVVEQPVDAIDLSDDGDSIITDLTESTLASNAIGSPEQKKRKRQRKKRKKGEDNGKATNLVQTQTDEQASKLLFGESVTE